MLYSHSIEGEKFKMFSLYLSSLLNGDDKYKQEVETVLKETHKLSTGAKTFYTVDRDYFPIIVYLFNSSKETFLNDSYNHPGRNEFDTVYQIIQTPGFVGSI